VHISTLVIEDSIATSFTLQIGSTAMHLICMQEAAT